MKKISIAIIIALILLVAGLMYIVYQDRLTGQVVESRYTYTKAVCDENNFCQDYEVTCLDGEVINTQPISGAVIQHSDEWEDPRKNKSEITCEIK